jgi:hypothetical protein
MIKFLKNDKGQTLIEAATALGVASIIIAAIAISILTSMDNATFSKNQNLATQYAQQGMDVLRQLSDSDWSTFNAYNGDYCFPAGSLILTAGPCTTANISSTFLRKATIEKPGAGCTLEKATISVSWADGKCTAGNYCHTVKLEACFAQTNTTNWP